MESAIGFPTATSEVNALCDLVRAEYAEMPGLCLTRSQMERLWSLDRSACDRVVQRLLSEGFLQQIRGDWYRRAANWSA